MSDKKIYNLSAVELNNGIGNTGLVLDNFRIRNDNNNNVLELDTGNNEWDIIGSDLNMNGNTIESVGNLSMTGNIELNGNNVTDIDTLKFREGTSITGDLEVDGTINTTGDLDLDGNDLVEPDELKTAGQNIQIRDTTNNQDIARFQEGGKAVIPNGNLDVQGQEINLDQSGKNRFARLDANVDQGNAFDMRLINESTLSSIFRIHPSGRLELQQRNPTQTQFEVKSSGNVEIPNGNLAITPGGSASANRPLKIQPSLGTGDVLSVTNADNSAEIFMVQNESGDGQVEIRDGSNTATVRLDSNGASKLGGGNVNIPNGNLDLGSNNIEGLNKLTDFFALSCSSGETVVNVTNTGEFQCMDVSDEVSTDYVNRSGDSMSGSLDMSLSGNDDILGVGDLGVETTNPSYDLDVNGHARISGNIFSSTWSDLNISKSDVSASDANLASLSPGSHISGNSYDGTSSETWDVSDDWVDEGSADLGNALTWDSNNNEVDHADTSSQGDTSTGGSTVIDDIGVDGRGHVDNMNTENRRISDWNAANSDISMGDNSITNIQSITSDGSRSQPNIVLHSTSNNDNWNDQGAYISIGESGSLGSASMHMTYRGDGKGWIGSGEVSNAVPQDSYFRFDYDSNQIYSPDNVEVGPIDTGHGNYEIGQDLLTSDTVTFSDVTISEDSFDLGDENLVHIDANNGLSGGGTNGLTDPVDLSVKWEDGNDLNSNGGVVQCNGDNDCEVNRLNFDNNEQPGNSGGRVYFDENFYGDYGSMSGDGGGLAVYSQDGWGAVYTTANDQHISPTFASNSITNSELSNHQVTIEGNTVSLGGSTSVNHNELSSISYNDHHGLGDDLTWDSNNNPRLTSGEIDVDDIDFGEGKIISTQGSASGLWMDFEGSDNTLDFRDYQNDGEVWLQIQNNGPVKLPDTNLDMNGNSVNNADDVETNDIYDDDDGTLDIKDAVDLNNHDLKSVEEAWIDENELGTYEWAEGRDGENAALKTTSIEVVDDNSDDTSTDPWISLHDYGGGGPRLRFNHDDKTLYLEEQQGNDNWDTFQVSGGNLDMNGNSVNSADDVETNDIYNDDNNWIDVQDNLDVEGDIYTNDGNIRANGGDILMNGYDLDNPSDINMNGGAYIDEGMADYGSIRVGGGCEGGWCGVNIQGQSDYVLMTDSDGDDVGLYDDDNNNWLMRYDASNSQIDSYQNLDMENNNINNVNNVYGNSGNDVVFQDRPQSEDGLYIDSGTSYFDNKIKVETIMDRSSSKSQINLGNSGKSLNDEDGDVGVYMDGAGEFNVDRGGTQKFVVGSDTVVKNGGFRIPVGSNAY